MKRDSFWLYIHQRREVRAIAIINQRNGSNSHAH
jgi:hypothetical protein